MSWPKLLAYCHEQTKEEGTNLNAVTSSTSCWLEIGRWSPDVATVVLGLLDNGVLWDGVLAWALEEDEGDGALGSWVPGDLVQVRKSSV